MGEAVDPVEKHLTENGESELGVDIIRLARQTGAKLPLSLTRMSPCDARHEAAWLCAREVLYGERAKHHRD